MANRKISDLTALTAPATGDLLPIVDISEAAAADKNKKITYGELLASAPAGSAAAPSFSFDGDPNTGIYNPGADQVAISTNGTGRLFIDASGNVGVATSSPGAAFHVAGTITSTPTGSGLLAGLNSNYSQVKLYGTTGGLLDFGASGADATARIRVDNANGDLQFHTGSSSEKVRITSAGLVGIGTSAPSQKLDVAGTIQSINTTAGVGQTANVTLNTVNTNFGNAKAAATLQTVCNTVANGANDFFIKQFNHNSGSDSDRVFQANSGSSGFISLYTVDTERARIDSSGRLLVGTSSARGVGSSTQALTQVETTTYVAYSAVNNTNDTGGSALMFGKSRGTAVGSNTIVQNNDNLGDIYFAGADGTDLESIAARITCTVDGTPGANDMPGRLVFSTTADGAASPTERMRIDNAGFTNTFSANNAFAARSSIGAGTSILLYGGYYSATSTTSGTNSYVVWTNGNVVNTNGSYGALSDIKLKENIVDANSQWDDLKALQVRNYNFKEGQTHTQIGLVAQEVELVSPGLVTESPDRDAEGNDLGTVTKSVSYSVLYMKAVKALQEAMERIETLEAKVAALESQ